MSGVVTWDDGTPAAGATITGVAPESMAMVQSKAGADGSYTLGPLPAGGVMVTASRKEGFAGMMHLRANKNAGKQMKTLTLEANEKKRGVDFTIEKGGLTVSGVVLAPDGKPVEGAAVSASTADDVMGSMRGAMGAMLGEKRIVTDAEGRFTVDDLTKGTYTVMAKSAGYPDAKVDKITAPAADVRIQLVQESVIAGVVVGSDGKPVTDFSVDAHELSAGGDEKEKVARLSRSMAALMGGKQMIHDAGGAFEVRGLAAGKYEVVATTADGRVGKIGAVEVGKGEKKPGVKITLGSGVTLRGKVVDFADGKPLPNLPIVLMGQHQAQQKTTGEDGSFSLEGLVPAPEVLLAIGGQGGPFLSEAKEVALSDGKPEVDLGVVRLVRGRAGRPMFGGGKESELGLHVAVKNGQPTIERVSPRSPAAEAKLTAGEPLSTIDGQSIVGVERNGLRQLLDVPPGTKVILGVGTGTAVRSVPLRRAASEERAASGERAPTGEENKR